MIELAGIAVLLLIALAAQHHSHREQLDQILAETSHERQKLLDRIQHPAVRQVEPQEPPIIHESPRDAAQMAQIGQVVPDFIDFGEEER